MTDTPRARVLDLLKRFGPVAADALGEKLGVTAMAVRQQLYSLEEDGLVTHETGPKDPSKGRGRPLKLWRATPAADSYFPDSHAALALDLIGQMRDAFGEDGLDTLLAKRTAAQEITYRAKTDAKRSLKARLDALVKIRSAEGYMAEVRRDPETGDYLFVENHCPICAAAALCQGLCREELALFRRVLGDGVSVERISHIVAGASRCAYRVQEIKKLRLDRPS
ncbi:MAG TPA: metalloregulator ArsR/SmtB family transcription factor [Rhizomicrobium sp.]|nr:metalloregulator ArsR/SmtB family transcription factor [Rhizomicrobium sp.]